MLKKSKGIVAIAMVHNTVNALVPVNIEARLSALESVKHWHSNLSALDMIRVYNSIVFSTNGFGVTLKSVITNYTITTSDTVVLCDATTANIVLTLPNPSLCYDTNNFASAKFTLSKIDSSAYTVTVNPFSTETINGSSSLILTIQNESVSFVTDGTNWYLI